MVVETVMWCAPAMGFVTIVLIIVMLAKAFSGKSYLGNRYDVMYEYLQEHGSLFAEPEVDGDNGRE